MRAYKLQPEDVLNEPHDDRSPMTLDQRVEELEDLERWHRLATAGRLAGTYTPIPFYFLDKDTPEDSMIARYANRRITLFSGDRGSGYTLLAVSLARYLYKVGLTVFSLGGLGFGHRVRERCGCLDLARALDRTPKNSVWLLDDMPSSTREDPDMDILAQALTRLPSQVGLILVLADLNALDTSVKGAVNSVVYARRDPSKRGPDAIRGVETGLKPSRTAPLSWTPAESILWASISAYSPMAGSHSPLGPLPSRPIEWFGEEGGAL